MEEDTLNRLRDYRNNLREFGNKQDTLSQNKKLLGISRASADGQSIAYYHSESLFERIFPEIRE